MPPDGSSIETRSVCRRSGGCGAASPRIDDASRRIANPPARRPGGEELRERRSGAEKLRVLPGVHRARGVPRAGTRHGSAARLEPFQIHLWNPARALESPDADALPGVGALRLGLAVEPRQVGRPLRAVLARPDGGPRGAGPPEGVEEVREHRHVLRLVHEREHEREPEIVTAREVDLPQGFHRALRRAGGDRDAPAPEEPTEASHGNEEAALRHRARQLPFQVDHAFCARARRSGRPVCTRSRSRLDLTRQPSVARVVSSDR